MPRPTHPTGIFEKSENSIVFVSAENIEAEMHIWAVHSSWDFV